MIELLLLLLGVVAFFVLVILCAFVFVAFILLIPYIGVILNIYSSFAFIGEAIGEGDFKDFTLNLINPVNSPILRLIVRIILLKITPLINTTGLTGPKAITNCITHFSFSPFLDYIFDIPAMLLLLVSIALTAFGIFQYSEDFFI